jgi:hypothetical protein
VGAGSFDSDRPFGKLRVRMSGLVDGGCGRGCHASRCTWFPVALSAVSALAALTAVEARTTGDVEILRGGDVSLTFLSHFSIAP